MSVNLRSLLTHRIIDFSGGLNEFDSSFTMEDRQLREAVNVELRTGGAIRTRKGAPIYQDQAYSPFTDPFTSLFRYARFDGTKKVLGYVGNDVVEDNDNGKFDPVLLNYESDDAKVRFAQWREAVFFSSRGVGDTSGHGSYVYDSNLTPRTRRFGAQGIGSITGQITGSNISPVFTDVATTNGVLIGAADSNYLYRFTLDIYEGNTFIGESNVLWDGAFGPGPPVFYDYPGAAQSAIAAGNNAYEIRSSAGLAAEAGNTSLGAINIYRSISNFTGATFPFPNQVETNMVYVGSITRDRWADTATVHILDEGLFSGKSIAPFYNRMQRPPFGRFLTIHKARLWMANVKYQWFDTTNAWVNNQVLTPHRIYFSEVNEPAVFLPTSWVELDPTDADGITAIISFKNKVIIAWQANSMWAISGGDEEVSPGVPDISVENISNDIGCVAPESVQVCDGRVVWRSHRGIYYYDGTSPKELNTIMIDGTLLDLTPDAVYTKSASAFLAKEKEYWISHASTEVNPTYQTLISKFSFKNLSWVRADHSPHGIASFLQKREATRAPILLAGLEATSSDLAATCIRRMETAGYDAVSTPIVWSWRTKFFDLGRPFMDKKFVAVLVQLESNTDVVMKVSCDNHLFDESFTIQNTENAQDFLGDDMVWADAGGTTGSTWSDGVTGTVWAGDNFRNALIYLNSKCWGKRISFQFSGENSGSPTEIQAITIFYDQKEGVRQ